MAPFKFEVVADSIAANSQVSLALDRAGNPRIAFSEQRSGQIIVAQRDNGAWTYERVSAFVGADDRPCLAIDSQGHPQLAYRDRDADVLMHAVKSGSQWSFTKVPTRLTPDHQPGGVSGLAFALAPGRLDPQERDAAFFAYVDLASGGIGFAHTGNVGPTPVKVEWSDGPPGLMSFGFPSAAFDPGEVFVIAYVGFQHSGSPQDNVSIRYTWITDIDKGKFATPGALEQSPQINVRTTPSAVRSATGDCVAYFDMANKTLKAFCGEFGQARIETIASNINNNASPSAAVKDPNFRVAYADSGVMKLASRDQFGDWTVETVDAVSGGSPSLVYDKAGNANIAYEAGAKVKYGTRSE